MKKLGLLHVVILIAVLSSPLSYSKNLGVMGETFEILELDLLVWMKTRMLQLQQNGTLNEIHKKMKETVKKRANRPKPVIGLTTTTNPLAYVIDPTLIVTKDIKDVKGNVIVKKGKKVNPFVALQHRYKWHLAFFDADDYRQIVWAKNVLAQYPDSTKLILTNGSINDTFNMLGERIYFDQGGFITNKLAIKHIPSLAYEKNNMWFVQEFDAGKHVNEEEK